MTAWSAVGYGVKINTQVGTSLYSTKRFKNSTLPRLLPLGMLDVQLAKLFGLKKP